MATVYWVGRQRVRQMVRTVTIGSATAAQTFTVTVGGRKAVTYTAGASETTSTVAAALYALIAAVADGEYTELTWDNPSGAPATITATGPADGRPFTLAVSGTGTISVATTYTALSPNDLGDAANYSGNALPSAGDTLVFEDGAVDALWNADALTAVALATVVRRQSYTGRIGLPSASGNGYPEYRAQYFEVDATQITLEEALGDAAGQVRVKCVHTGSATTVTASGDGGRAVGDEVFDLHGLPSSSVLQATRTSVALATLAGQVATAATVVGEDASLWLGAGVTLTTATLMSCQARLECSYTTLTMLVGGRVEVTGAAAGANNGTVVNRGTLVWRSTGATGNSPVVGQGAVIDFSQAPATVTVGGTVELNAGGTWYDPAGRVATSYNIKLNRCGIEDVSIVVGANRTVAVS